MKNVIKKNYLRLLAILISLSLLIPSVLWFLSNAIAWLSLPAKWAPFYWMIPFVTMIGCLYISIRKKEINRKIILKIMIASVLGWSVPLLLPFESSSNDIIFLIPEKYQGNVKIRANEKEGIRPVLENNTYIIKISTKGIAVLNDLSIFDKRHRQIFIYEKSKVQIPHEHIKNVRFSSNGTKLTEHLTFDIRK
jgi:hypothetical protein